MKFWKWFIANTTDRFVWRVTYKDGKRTYPLSKREAKPLSEIYNGKLWIDYEKGFF